MKIIDAHHHFWDPVANYHPWLRDEPMIPFRYGDYSSIRKRFMPADYAAVSQNWDVVATVTMEGEWDSNDPAGEAQWMQALARQAGHPAAHVAQAWLDRDDLAEVLDVYDDLPIVKSVRHKPRANPAPGGPAGGMTDKAFRNGFKRLMAHGVSFDLQTPWWHLDEAIGLARVEPCTPIILNHAGLPSDRSAQGMAGWRAALERFSALPQTCIKISGIGLPGRAWSVDDNRDIINMCIDTFGPERAMFASNFPVDGLCGSFNTILEGFELATRHYTEKEREALFRATAERVYSITNIS